MVGAAHCYHLVAHRLIGQQEHVRLTDDLLLQPNALGNLPGELGYKVAHAVDDAPGTCSERLVDIHAPTVKEEQIQRRDPIAPGKRRQRRPAHSQIVAQHKSAAQEGPLRNGMQERQGNTIGQARIATCIALAAGQRQAQVTPLDLHDPRLGQMQQ